MFRYLSRCWRSKFWITITNIIGMTGTILFLTLKIWPNLIPAIGNNSAYMEVFFIFVLGFFTFCFFGDLISNTIRSFTETDRKDVAYQFNNEQQDIIAMVLKEKNKEKKQELEQQALVLRQEYESLMSENLRRRDGTFVEDWRESLLVARKRLADEEQRLLAGNAINRRMGVLMAFAGVSLPAYYIFSDKGVVANVGFGAFFSTYWPFFTIVIIFEIVAIFYLRLYTQTLRRIEKNKNEITNIELRLTAGLMLCDKTDKAKLKSLANDLAKEERNFVLDKNESSAVLDTDKLIEITSKFTPKIGT